MREGGGEALLVALLVLCRGWRGKCKRKCCVEETAENSGLALLEGAADQRNTLLSLSASRPLHPPRVPKEMAESEGRKILCVSERGKGYGSVVLW